jgi:hypothetical protein
MRRSVYLETNRVTWNSFGAFRLCQQVEDEINWWGIRSQGCLKFIWSTILIFICTSRFIQVIRHENKELLNRLFIFFCAQEGLGGGGEIAICGPKVGTCGRHELHARPLLSPPSLAHLNYLLALSDVWLRQDNVSLLCMRPYHYYYYYCCYSYTDCSTNNEPPEVCCAQWKSLFGIWDSHSGEYENVCLLGYNAV